MIKNRNVITQRTLTSLHSSGGAEVAIGEGGKVVLDSGVERIIKHIPAEVVTFYTGILTLLKEFGWLKDPSWPFILLFFIALGGTPLYLIRLYNVQVKSQLWISTISFAAWAMFIGSPLDQYFDEASKLGGLLVVVVNFIIPLANNK